MKVTHFSHDHAAVTTALDRLLLPRLLAGLLVPRQLPYVPSGAPSRREAICFDVAQRVQVGFAHRSISFSPRLGFVTPSNFGHTIPRRVFNCSRE